jgi:hypothetical protein
MEGDMPMTMTKAGVDLSIVAALPDGTKILRTCDCPECRKLGVRGSGLRFKLLPCGCHGVIVECTCRVHDKRCQTCGRVFVATAPYVVKGKRFVDVYEIEDPHGANAKL